MKTSVSHYDKVSYWVTRSPLSSPEQLRNNSLSISRRTTSVPRILVKIGYVDISFLLHFWSNKSQGDCTTPHSANQVKRQTLIKCQISPTVIKYQVSPTVIKYQISPTAVICQLSPSVIKYQLSHTVIKCQLSPAIIKYQLLPRIHIIRCHPKHPLLPTTKRYKLMKHLSPTNHSKDQLSQNIYREAKIKYK